MPLPCWLRLPRRYAIPLAGVGGLLLLDLLRLLVAEGLWFQRVEHLRVFWLRLGVQGGLGLLGFGLSLVFLWGNLAIAHRHSDPHLNLTAIPRFGGLRLRPLAVLVSGISLLMSAALAYHAGVAISHWRPALSVYTPAVQVPVRFRAEVLGQLLIQSFQQPWLALMILGLAVGLLVYPRVLLWGWALLTSLGFGLVLSEYWAKLLLAASPTPFDRADPLFGQDIGFYVFRLPALELLSYWAMGLTLLGLLSVVLVYLLAGDSLSEGKFLGWSLPQLRHLCGLGGVLMLAIALAHWLNRYGLLYSTSGVAYGAGFTNVHVRLPIHSILAVAALVLGVILLWQAIASQRWRAVPAVSAAPLRGSAASLPNRGFVSRTAATPGLPPFASQSRGRVPSASADSALSLRGWRSREERIAEYAQWSGAAVDLPLRSGLGAEETVALLPRRVPPLFWGPMLHLAVAAIATTLIPFVVQSFVVQPNELALETPYIQRTIALTRDAFNLQVIQDDIFDPQTDLTREDLQANNLTIDNIRLWDSRPLLETNRQLQRIRPYYEFPDADLDRYQLPTTQGTIGLRQVLIAARELDYSGVPADAQTWVNQHLIYTHGYGFTVSPVNTADEGGLPSYFVEGVEQVVSDPRIPALLPTDNPRIYFGELTNNFVLTRTRALELDYPSGGENVYNTYSGSGGIPIGSYWRRLLFARHLNDWRMLFSDQLTGESQLLYRRNIVKRVQAIAPFLRFDRDPYPVAVELDEKISNTDSPPSSLYWVIDAYTTSDRYPYSDPRNNDFNYIRNSVKIVVDAYNGSVTFYIADPSDPIIQSWSRLLPQMFRPFDSMPPALRNHIRYPQDYYQVQSNQLMTYHMTDPQIFYNREDEWREPNEIYANESQIVAPYYLITKLPIADAEEFVLLRLFTPSQRTNLIGWLAARSDGENYGKVLLYRFPKQRLIFGPEQIEARINQDPLISQQISLWNRQGSRAIQGNLLVIPVEDSLLYVEPLYLQADQNRLPTLTRVIVAYGNRIVMAETLQQALDAIFAEAPVDGTPADGTVDANPEAPPNGTIVRPLPETGVEGALP
ncbi:UPF0182 family protein [Thermoleptolyngbya sp. PKUAC-SCTB121]|uniref:UPF0182 family protein n=1 Tax=Thermoleptolyngbya sp. PKUAC-SCTB121 TaxID=2811482 RepID=UPI001962D3AA|nr:UPF0182 family protein [Thermoleptolyngbya sp. PKUAC-SCTB121]